VIRVVVDDVGFLAADAIVRPATTRLDPTAAALYLAWYAFCLVAWYMLPGDWVKGSQLRDGGFQYYKINGKCSTMRFPVRI